MTKRILVLLMAVFMVFAATACGTSTTEQSTSLSTASDSLAQAGNGTASIVNQENSTTPTQGVSLNTEYLSLLGMPQAEAVQKLGLSATAGEGSFGTVSVGTTGAISTDAGSYSISCSLDLYVDTDEFNKIVRSASAQTYAAVYAAIPPEVPVKYIFVQVVGKAGVPLFFNNIEGPFTNELMESIMGTPLAEQHPTHGTLGGAGAYEDILFADYLYEGFYVRLRYDRMNTDIGFTISSMMFSLEPFPEMDY